MKKFSFIIYCVLFVVSAAISHADCRGCCSGHGGAACIDGVTLCKDGTPLTTTCLEKCDRCEIDSPRLAAVKISKPPARSKAIIGNRWNDSFAQAKKTLEDQIYTDQRITFYCRSPFDAKKRILPSDKYSPKNAGERSRRVEWEHIVPAAHFGQSFAEWRDGHPDCRDGKGRVFKGRDCASKVALQYRYMESDMYNLVPAIGEVNGLRSNFRFDMISGEDRDFGACDMEIDPKARIAEPPEHVRGDIARTYKYMDQTYPGHGIISGSAAKLFNAWAKLDPVDARECARNRRIERIQGNENPIVKAACREAGM